MCLRLLSRDFAVLSSLDERNRHLSIKVLGASPELTAAETKECADKLVNTRSQRFSSTSTKADMKRELMPRKETSKEVSAKRWDSRSSRWGVFVRQKCAS